MTMLIGVYGASGFGKEVMPLVRQQFPTLAKENFIFIDDGKAGTHLNGYSVLTYTDFIKQPVSNKLVTIAIANSSVREKLVTQLNQDNINTYQFKHQIRLCWMRLKLVKVVYFVHLPV
jgi:hypothetical protein